MAGGSDLRVGFEEFTGLSVGRALLMAVPALALALVAAAFWLAVQFLDPLPPRRIVLATGPEGSALHALAPCRQTTCWRNWTGSRTRWLARRSRS